MADRVTRADVTRIAATVSESLNGLRVEVSRRNEHLAVDLFDADGCVDNLHNGTTREVYTYLQGMRRALLITNRADS